VILAYTLVGIGTVMAGVGSLIAAVVAVKSLRETRGVKSDLAENTAITTRLAGGADDDHQ
jgi:hypothetical protein